METRRDLLLVCLLLASTVSILGSGCGTSAPDPAPAGDPASTPEEAFDHDLAVATFDSAWSTIHRTHFDPEFGGVDWGAVREELRPEAQAATSTSELRSVLREMIARTELSHFGLIDGAAVDALRVEEDAEDEGSTNGHDHGDADVGIRARLVGDQVLVWKVRTGSPADEAGIRPGWILRTLEGQDLQERIGRAREHHADAKLEILVASMLTNLQQGRSGSTLALTLVDGEGAERAMELERVEGPGVVSQFGNLPPLRASLTHELVEYQGEDVGVIAFNIWLLPVSAQFDRAIDLYRDADGLVIDLRGNVGGVGAMSMGMAGHLLDDRDSLGVMSTRTTRLEFRANPRRVNAAGERVEPYSGPVAILVDPMSLSTSEIFAQGLQTLGRARVFGERSAGAALPSALTRLPNGDVLQHAFADFVDPEGTRLEGRGVIPDETVPLRREDLLAGRDAPLEAALRWIHAENES